MKQQDVFKKIGAIVKEIKEQYEYLSEDPEQISELELELFAANASFLKDHTEILRKLNAKNASQNEIRKPDAKPAIEIVEPAVERVPDPVVENAASEEPGKQEEKFFEPVVQRLSSNQFTPDKGGDITTPVATEADDLIPEAETQDSEPETIRHELIIDEADLWEDEDEELYDSEDIIEEEGVTEESEPQAVETEPINTMPVEDAEPEADDNDEPEITAVETRPINTMPATEPRFDDAATKSDEPVRTINQRISDQLGEKKQPVPPPVSDLKSAINLNDKLLYIKDLFNGYSLAYSEAIEILNRFHSFDEADRFLNANYVVKNNWESKQATATKFYDLLKRRYA
ncbi:hypothetical protein DJ568_13020 [Mucilaginibacter hurinus]|uniref:Uncharacterized protein n=1 Tax=Mucilaginibacter hurinus TaxID=2201324 RepID=A0A367GMF3_9SPHI|nr:hypothetical protein [Mucilaginibacter hurinus]RCH54215.1 hypothetical protein DJ568_13020 [Mucilaginibacter hurinus]